MSRSLLLALCLLPGTATAASGGPDSYGYYYIDSDTSGGPTYDSTVITDAVSGGTVLGNTSSTGASGADDSNSTMSLAFSFPFYGSNYSTLYVCSNGFVSFTSSTSSSNTALSSSSTAMVAPFWDDLDNNGTDSWVYRDSSGSYPNRSQNIVFYRTEHYNDTSNYGEITFAVQLFENGNIRMLWSDVTFEGSGGSSYSAGLSATVGIDGGSTTGYYTQLSSSSAAYLTASKVVEFIHPDNMPVAALAGGSFSTEGGTVNIDAGTSTPSSGLSYSFDCETDGTYEVTDSSTSEYDCPYDDDGSYTATVEVEYLTYTDTATRSVTISNVDPDPVSWFATTTGSATTGATVDDIVFDGIDEGDVDSVSVACDFDDVASDTIEVTIDWDDGTTDTTSNYTVVSHTYDDEGTYTVSCIGSDEDGGESSDLITSLGYSLTVEVENVAPSIASVSAAGADEGVAASFVASVSDPGSDTLSYAWTFGDGATGTGASASHTYADSGSYAWTLRVSDGDGGVATTSGTVVITDDAPSLTALSLPTVAEGSAATLGATVTAWSGDTLTYAWTFGDGATGTGAAPSHSWEENGSYTVSLVVTDDEGSTTSLSSTMTVTNANPVASFSASVADEGAVSTFYGGATDAGVADTFTYSWDFGDGSIDSGETAWHTFTNDGKYTVTLTVTDDDGGTDTEVQVITVGNTAPVLTSASGDAALVEGDAGTYTASATDEGADVLSYTWDFDDGTTATGSTVSHAWIQDGTYSVVVTADDGLDSDSTTVTVTVSNGAPSIVSASGDNGPEGTALAFVAAASDPGTSDVLTYAWDFGDGATGSGDGLSHAFPDNGTYTVTLTVSDDGGASVDTSFAVTITNADPVVVSTAGEDAQEAVLYSYTAVASDPGSADTLVWSLDVAPAAASFDAATGTVTWTPTYADSFTTHSFTVSVADDDGGSGSQSWTVTVDSLDSDGDGMADGYEDAYGFDSADASDGMADADADGISNTDEAMAGTDPTVFDGPSVPESALMVEPDFDILEPPLSIFNSTSPRGLTLTYDYELYSDEAGTALVTSTANVPEDPAGVTDWWVDVTLTDDTAYWWRARANDAYVSSAWMEFDPIFVNLENSTPSIPVPVSPIDNDAVSVLAPSMVWTTATDEEGQPFRYDVQVWTGDGASMVAEGVQIEDDGTDAWGEWVVTPDLGDEASYLWTVRAVDTQGADSEWSDFAAFRVSTSGLAPLDVNWISPRDGEELVSVSPLLEWTASEDPEGYAVTYHVQADVASSFDSADQLDEIVDVPLLDLAAAGLVLPENTLLFLRVRAEDVSGTGSAWETIEVNSRGENDAPPWPELLSPVAGELVAPEAELVFAEAVDPEGDAVRYTVVVSANADLSEPIFEENWVATGTGTVTGMVVPPLAFGDWYWSANTTDSFGVASEWAPAAEFSVGDVPVGDTGGDVDTGPDKGAGDDDCACASGGSAWPTVLVSLAAGLAARRRRTS